MRLVDVIFTSPDLTFALQCCGALTKLDADLKVVHVTGQRTAGRLSSAS